MPKKLSNQKGPIIPPVQKETAGTSENSSLPQKVTPGQSQNSVAGSTDDDDSFSPSPNPPFKLGLPPMKLAIPTSHKVPTIDSNQPGLVPDESSKAQIDRDFTSLNIETDLVGAATFIDEFEERLTNLTQSTVPSSADARVELLSIFTDLAELTKTHMASWAERRSLIEIIVNSPFYQNSLQCHAANGAEGSEEIRSLLGPSLDDLVLKTLQTNPGSLPESYNLKPARKYHKAGASEHSFFHSEIGDLILTNRFFDKDGEVINTKGKKAAFGGAQGTVRHGVWFSGSPGTGPTPVAVKKASLGRRGLTGDNRLTFAREAYFLELCSSPNVIAVLDSFAADNGKAYLLAEAGDCALGSPEARSHLLDNLPALKRIALDSIQGLARIHEAGVMHRDIKPDNLILVNGVAKVGDFGLATLTAPNKRTAGTAAYNGADHQQSPKTDVFALGLTLVELYYGHTPDPFGFSSLDSIPELQTESPTNDFLRLFLNPDPSQRPTAQSLLQHPFLQDIPDDGVDLDGGPLVNVPTTETYQKTVGKLTEFREAQ